MGPDPFLVVKRDDETDGDGCRDDFHENSLRLCSAYSTYSSGGEPSYTTLTERMKATVDYIFHSAEALVPIHLLSIPSIDDLEGITPGRPMLCSDDALPQPQYCLDRVKGKTARSAGHKWIPSVKLDPASYMALIPNQNFPSDHIALMAELALVPPYISAQWRALVT